MNKQMKHDTSNMILDRIRKRNRKENEKKDDTP